MYIRAIAETRVKMRNAAMTMKRLKFKMKNILPTPCTMMVVCHFTPSLYVAILNLQDFSFTCIDVLDYDGQNFSPYLDLTSITQKGSHISIRNFVGT